MDAVETLRSQLPVLQRLAYLNAGTCGPVPEVARQAAVDAWAYATAEGRGGAFYQRLVPLAEELRGRYASLLNASADDIALTAGTSDGCAHVIASLGLGEGDEVVTADDEHPGVTGPLIAAREQRGVRLTAVPLAEIPNAIGDTTKLVACSHVSWHSGAVAPVADVVAAAARAGAPVLLDGAQGVGAVGVDVAALGVDFYAGSGQKWLCGPVGTGMLYVSPEWTTRLASPGPSYGGLTDPSAGLDSGLVDTARRHDTPLRDLSTVAAAVAAFDVLDQAGFEDLQARGAALAAELADALADRGLAVVPRGATTLVSWEVADDETAVATRDRLQDAGVTIRDLPGAARLRASVGGWNTEDDLDRLLAAL
ncbi:MAG TPA: aminotransferase class V-fold PLP-dependent enzyme [Baekduia sp.]|uniref:aminotransferase class V-fold PLP-dependent enzyme n=1 Tax=Baekduia sp. TaxID=2600305 RepID=UPI002D7930BB|nr:aminotransferase class V-fold PLP-dependent enzyme [Baekduia sp.]HET6508473.1 aminotransferase class V-fold PLP-dependent enzyme [Baekduia sp.]